MNDRKSIHTRQRKAPLRGARLCYRTAHAVQTRQAHHDNMAMALCTLVRAPVGMSCDQKASAVCCQHAASSSNHMAGATGRAGDCKRPTGREADAGFCRFGFLWETVLQDFQRRKSALGRLKMRVLGLQNAKFSSRGSAPHPAGARAPDPPESATLTVTIIPVAPDPPSEPRAHRAQRSQPRARMRSLW